MTVKAAGAHVVARSHVGAVQTVSPLLEQAELERAVAHDARIGRAAGQVLLHKTGHHTVLKLPAHVSRYVLHVQPLGQTPRPQQEVGLVGPVLKLARKVPHAHGHAHRFVAGLLQQQAHGRTVNAARHAHQYTLVCFHIFSSYQS